MDIRIVLAYIVGIILLFTIGRVLLIPLKVVLRLIYNALLGGIVLVAINLAGGLFNFQIALNIFSAFIVGTLGVPGIVLLIVLKFIFYMP